MLHPRTVSELSHNVADLMNDFWQKRSHLPYESYFVFRLVASDFDTDTDVNLYVHFLIQNGRWYFMMSDSMFDVTKEVITETFDDDDIMRDLRRVQSWRHYAFSDLVQNYIEDQMNEKIEAKNMNINQLTIWDLFPIYDLR
jgi:hypothetical protein